MLTQRELLDWKKEIAPVEPLPSVMEVDESNSHVNLIQSKSNRSEWTAEELNLLLEEGYKVSFGETTWEKSS